MNKVNKKFWEELSTLYDRAMDLPVNERFSFIDNCTSNDKLKKELRSLLKVQENSLNYFDSLSENLICPAYEELSDPPPGSGRVDNYKIIKKLGRGGMGTVYLAKRDDNTYESLVAVKILRRGMDTDDILARFRVERQILARLNHPNITHLLDGGITCDGRPYFVMEYIQGKPITTWCDDKKLTLRERIQLFMQICDALQYAHQNLVIHRDLKPGNILVTESGQVKLLDFGIAKLIDNDNSDYRTLAESEHRLMTPEFASPEQVLGKPINTASDIYQLGVVLYRLLSGNLPFVFDNKTLTETESLILNKEPVKPSKKLCELEPENIEQISDSRLSSKQNICQQLRGDLDTIILRALHKDPEHRFSSVADLKDDLGRHLNGLPVKSRGESVSYKTGKFLKRNRVAVGAVAGFVSLLLVLGFLHSMSIADERNQAQQEAAKAAQITSFLMDLFEANDPNQAQGETITARQLLERGEQQIENLEGQPEVQAQMLDVTGQIYRKLGQFDRSYELLNKAYELKKSRLGFDHEETLSTMDNIGLVLSDKAAFEKAETILREAMNIRKNHLSLRSPELAVTLSNLAFVLRRKGDYTAAEKLYRESLELRRSQLGPSHPLTVESMSSLGVTYLNTGDYEEGEKIFREVLAHRTEELGPIHPDLAMSQNNLGALLLLRGKFEEAQTYFEKSLGMRTRLFGDAHPTVALTMNNLAISFLEQAKYNQAAEYFDSALEMRLGLFGEDNINTAISLYSKAGLKLMVEKPEEALEFYEKAHNIFYKKLSPNHSFTPRSELGIGRAYLMLGEYIKAEYHLNRGYAGVLQIHPEASLERALAQWEYSSLLAAKGRIGEADNLLQEAFAALQKIEGRHSLRQERLLKNRREILNYPNDITHSFSIE